MIKYLLIIAITISLLSCEAFKGPKGDPGPRGEPGDPNIENVVLCPSISGPYPENLLRINDVLYAVYYDASRGASLVVVTPGNYVSTDGRNCHFTVHNDLTVTY